MLDIGSAKVDWCVITKAITNIITKQHKWDSNTRYRDNPHFQDPLRLEKGYTKLANKNN